jgi:hypothetical protein
LFRFVRTGKYLKTRVRFQNLMRLKL